MSKINPIDLLESGIRATGMRGTAIANNIANFQTPGYRRLAVDFEGMLSSAMKSADAAQVLQVTPKLYSPKDTPVDDRGNDVQLELEIGGMIQNGAVRKAYLRMMSKTYSQMEMAMRVE